MLTSSACILSISESNSDPRYVRWNIDNALKNMLTPYTHIVYNNKKEKKKRSQFNNITPLGIPVEICELEISPYTNI